MHVLQGGDVIVANGQLVFDLREEDVAEAHVADVVAQGGHHQPQTLQVAQIRLRGDEIYDAPQREGGIHSMAPGVIRSFLAAVVPVFALTQEVGAAIQPLWAGLDLVADGIGPLSEEQGKGEVVNFLVAEGQSVELPLQELVPANAHFLQLRRNDLCHVLCVSFWQDIVQVRLVLVQDLIEPGVVGVSLQPGQVSTTAKPSQGVGVDGGLLHRDLAQRDDLFQNLVQEPRLRAEGIGAVAVLVVLVGGDLAPGAHRCHRLENVRRHVMYMLQQLLQGCQHNGGHRVRQEERGDNHHDHNCHDKQTV
mmetsp:Transcript_100142/g.238757  ORF Transcript_100142/g.238757 Transcript_100142/m.238757 type:complete len:306 (-) Transcript_100142:2384-3301(-)